VYVQFASTENISVGDTLFTSTDVSLIPALIVKDLSSISCVCSSLSSQPFSVGNKVAARVKESNPTPPGEKKANQAIPTPVVDADTISGRKVVPIELKQIISGRISIASYSNFSSVSDFSQRMRYNFSLDARHIGNSRVSFETYISFVHKLKEWSEVQKNVFNGLKIYNLAFNYEVNKNNSIWIGRRINPRLASVGAIDGIQYDAKIKSFTAGVFAGTRPDYMNYSFNANLLQYGGYLGHELSTPKGSMQSSVAFVEQTNKGRVDRKFAYFQHTNSLLPKLYLFGSLEFDLYNQVRNAQDSSLVQKNNPKLSNLYVSLRYKVLKQLSLSLSYSERQNIIYYETYKDIIERLLETSTMKGYMFQVNYRPVNNISIGSNAGYRFGDADPRPSKNLYSYITFNTVPWIKASATLSATFLETSYLNSSIYSCGISRDLIPGKFSCGLNYRHVNYKFQSNQEAVIQNMAELNISWRILKKLSLTMNCEGTFEKTRNYDLVYVSLTQRF
jgi:hypothetical protein